jgi:hypothetical protein
MSALQLHKQIRARVGRDGVRLLLKAVLRWTPEPAWTPGYSIILGVPWHLRHLLNTNLRFIARQDRTNLRAVHCVLDRVAPDTLATMREKVLQQFPDLPLQFHCYRGFVGRVIERADVSTFYNGMNCATALQAIETRHAILHDFDLYPLAADYFERVYRQMQRDGLRFCGTEFTRFDGLTDEDRIIGTWCLGMDVEWLRRECRLVDIFHVLQRIRDRWVSLDPFSQIQFNRQPPRALVDGVERTDFCHVTNLCSSYLRFSTGRPLAVAWRLHYLWYLEHLEGVRPLSSVTDAMSRATDRFLAIDGRRIDFGDVHPTCANVLERELHQMDRALFGEVRPETAEYIAAFREFLGGTREATGSTTGPSVAQ